MLVEDDVKVVVVVLGVLVVAGALVDGNPQGLKVFTPQLSVKFEFGSLQHAEMVVSMHCGIV